MSTKLELKVRKEVEKMLAEWVAQEVARVLRERGTHAEALK